MSFNVLSVLQVMVKVCVTSTPRCSQREQQWLSPLWSPWCRTKSWASSKELPKKVKCRYSWCIFFEVAYYCVYVKSMSETVLTFSISNPIWTYQLKFFYYMRLIIKENDLLQTHLCHSHLILFCSVPPPFDLFKFFLWQKILSA